MSDIDVPPKQRALVFQGSVALGAFEAGVFKRSYDIIKENDTNWKKHMFDIVAGNFRWCHKCCDTNKPCKAKRELGGFSRKTRTILERSFVFPNSRYYKTGNILVG